jgi:glycerol uptake facilitator-like aquaporin
MVSLGVQIYTVYWKPWYQTQHIAISNGVYNGDTALGMLSFLASFCSEFLCCFIFCILISHSCIPSYKLNLIFLSSKDLQVGFFHHALVNSL